MKKYFILAAAALAMVACSKNEAPEYPVNENEGNEILFSSRTAGMTRADHVGADAADLLNSNFVVMGTKGGAINTPASVVTAQTVFDHYNVKWLPNTAHTTESNSADWEYVGITPLHAYATAHGISEQSIKYWDYSVGQYDFIAYSAGTATVNYTAAAANQLYITPITPATATAAVGGAYTVTGATADLAKFYIADLVTAYNPAYTSAPKPVTMGNEVQIKFRNLTAKVRIGLYETVPGYSIRDVEFYASDVATEKVGGDVLSLYSQTSSIYSDGTYTIYYPTVDQNMANPGKQASDYNKAHVVFTPTPSTGSSTVSSYATLTYTNSKTLEDGATPGVKEAKNYLGEESNNATYVTSSSTYTTVLPNESAGALTLRVNYTLVSNDGSKETIKVWGAKAVVPAQYTQWKPNYAYTYLFKISDNTNGQTQALGLGQVGLTPITFDAGVVETEDGIQESVTTVATPSITTYSPGVQPTANNEYLTTKTIYVMVQDGASILNLSTNGQLYTVTGATSLVPATEANVMDALNMRADDSTDPINGRNNLVLTPVSSDATITAIPGVNGNDIVISAGQAASFTAGAAGTIYAYVYTVSDAADTEYNTAVVLTAEPGDWNASDNVYYTDFACTSKANTAYADGTYYKKYTNNNTTYAVKVIRIKA